MKILSTFLIFFVFQNFLFAQTNRVDYINPLNKTFHITFNGGVTYPLVDFTTSKFGFYSQSGLEYFFSSYSAGIFGIKLTGGYGQLSGKSKTGLMIGDSPASLSTEFNTKFLDGKFGLVYALDLGGFIPYFWGGGNSVFWFQPKDINGSIVYAKQRDIVISYFGELGFKIMLADGLSLNFAGSYNASGTDELDGYVSMKKDIYFGGTIGISIIFGGVKDSDNDGVADDFDLCPNTPSGITVDELGCPIKIVLDDDEDGISNEFDKCPNTPRNVIIDKNGCPIDSDGDFIPDYLDKCPNTAKDTPVNSDGCPLDSDADGVADNIDVCPNTPSGVLVDEKGCPKDTDGDGVADYLDKCLNTPAGDKVDEFGCTIVIKEEPKEIILQGMTTFESSKATLIESAKIELSKIAKVMLENPQTKWRIEGHTDSQGSARFNKKLSKDRAIAVMNYLVGLGISSERLTAAGMGEDYPIADNSTEEGKQQNRRVVITRIN